MTKLYLVGTGPGDKDLIAPKAMAAVLASSDLVAYGLYIEQIP